MLSLDWMGTGYNAKRVYLDLPSLRTVANLSSDLRLGERYDSSLYMDPLAVLRVFVECVDVEVMDDD